MTKLKNKLLVGAAALFASFSASAAIEVGFLDAEALGLYDKPTLADNTLLAETENVAMYLENRQNCSQQNPVYDGMNTFIVNGQEIKLVPGIGGDTNPPSVNINNGPSQGGCQYHLTVKKDGWIIIPSRVSSNKNYYVYEGTFAGKMNPMAYTLGMEIQTAYYPGLTHGVYTLPADEFGYFDLNSPEADNYLLGGTAIAWPIRIFIQNPEAESAGNGTGAIMFPVYADAGDYYVFATGSKMNTCGFIFVEGDPKGEAPSLTVYGPERTTGDGVSYPAKSFAITGELQTINPNPDPDPDIVVNHGNTHIITYVPTEGQIIKADDITMTYSSSAEWYYFPDRLPYEYGGVSWTEFANGEKNPSVRKEATMIPDGGTYYKFRATKDGVLTIPSVPYINKPVYVVTDNNENLVPGKVTLYSPENDNCSWYELFTEDGESDGWAITTSSTGLFPCVMSFNVKADQDYYVYAYGSRFRICGFIFNPGITIPDPNPNPNPDPDPDPDPTPTPGTAEVGFIDAEALELSYAPTIASNTLLAETEHVSMYLENEQECTLQNPDFNGMKSLIVDGQEIKLVPGIGGSSNPPSVNINNGPSQGGCQYHLTVKKDGWIIIPSKVSSNKNYYVYEGTFASKMNPMAYTLGMEISNADYPGLTHGVYTLPADEFGYFDLNSPEADNYLFGGTAIAWPIRIFIQNPEAESAGNGTGAIMFPVYAEAGDYYVFCTGSKMNTCGFIFVEGDPKGEAPALTVYGPERTDMETGEVYPAKSFAISGELQTVNPDPTPDPTPRSIKLSLEMQVNSTMQFNALISPEEATATATWTTTDSDIITVSETGAVTAHAEGTASVVATTSNNLTASLEIKVVPATAPGIVLVKSINLNPDLIYEEEGTQVQLNATVLPDDATDKSLVWSSTNTAVATVDQNGLVSIIAAGTAVVKASATDGSGVVGFCDVTGVDEFTAIPTVTADELENQDVYSIDGRLMIRNASLAEISRLAPGIYIIGERKVAIR